MEFAGKAVVVTGGANGIGLAACQDFAAKGARVLVVDHDETAGAATAQMLGAQARFAAADVSRSADVRRYVQVALDEFGGIDCFFNNAGIEGRVAPTAECDEAMFDSVIAVNLKGVFLGLRHVLPVMLRQGRGAIVNTASTAGLLGSPGLPAYVASKHGVLGLTRTAAGEVAGQGVRVNAICPGPTETRMIRSLEEQASPGNHESVGERYRATIPLGRYSTPAEIAATVLFLCSDAAASITGAHFTIDGGRTASPARPFRN